MDLLLEENGDGGELVKTPKDLAVIYGLENMIYLGLFGGNVEASTPIDRIASEVDYSWWGNAFLEPAAQFNSETERTLKSVALNGAGRVAVEQAVKKDLEFMKDFADITVAVSIPAIDRALIEIKVQQPNNVQQQEFVFIWDGTKRELTAES